jgi:hypothetical protein
LTEEERAASTKKRDAHRHAAKDKKSATKDQAEILLALQANTNIEIFTTKLSCMPLSYSRALFFLIHGGMPPVPPQRARSRPRLQDRTCCHNCLHCKVERHAPSRRTRTPLSRPEWSRSSSLEIPFLHPGHLLPLDLNRTLVPVDLGMVA